MSSHRMISNLSLTGFMGVGKSTLGRFLANSLRYQFVDTDDMIEQRSGKPITKIFEDDGEDSFRSLEQEIVDEMVSWKRRVISTGGGLITKNNNLERLKAYSFVVCLWASPETIYHRIKRQSHRPLLQTTDPVRRIEDLLEERSVFYKQSDYMVNTDKRPLRVVAQLVTHQFHQALNHCRQTRTGG